MRRPGHHADYGAAGGLCFFNNVAGGIRHALNVHGLQRVALIDFDVHHGNRSEDILHDDERVRMCSIFEDKLYPFCGNHARGANMVNVALPTRCGGELVPQAVTELGLPALERFRPQLMFISAGFDGHREDDMGNLALVEADDAWITRQIVDVASRHCAGRIVSCLEGGYELS